MNPKLTNEDVARFWSGVDRSDPEKCWPWRPGLRGYGQFQLGRGRDRRPYGAHRIAHLIANGPIADGAWILHSCDSPPCVNPAHLRTGTPKDNTADKLARDRMNKHPAYLMSILSASISLGISEDAIRKAIYRGALRDCRRLATWHIPKREVERYRAESLGRRGRHASAASSRAPIHSATGATTPFPQHR